MSVFTTEEGSIPERIAKQAEESRKFISEKWTLTSDMADKAFDTAVEAIENIAAESFPEITRPSIDWEDVSVDFSINLVKPTLPDITFRWPATKPTIGALKEYPAVAFPLSTFNLLNSEVIAAIRLKLETGGTGLGAAAEAALWARMRGRNDAKNESAYAEAQNFFAARGYDVPPGVLSGRLLQVQAEILRSETDLNNDITVEQARLTQENEKFIYELALKAVTDYYRNSIEAVAAQNKNVVDVFLGQMEGYKVDVQAEASRVDALAKVINALMEGYKADAQAQGILVEAKAKVVDSEIRQQVAKAEIELKLADIDIQVAKFVWSTQIEVFKAIATVASQLAASAMAAVNASVNSGYSASSNEASNWGTNFAWDKTKRDNTGVILQHVHTWDETK